jgi:dGTPase
MEVQQVGRYIAKEILSRLKEKKQLEAYGLDELTGPFESIVEMACLMHDIGNRRLVTLVKRQSMTGSASAWHRRMRCASLSHDRCEVVSLQLRR